MSEQTNRLVRFYEDYAPSRFHQSDGTPYKRRTQQILAKKLRLPLIRAGHSILIDPDRADDVLRELAEHQEQEAPRRRGRGRPRLYP